MVWGWQLACLKSGRKIGTYMLWDWEENSWKMEKYVHLLSDWCLDLGENVGGEICCQSGIRALEAADQRADPIYEERNIMKYT